MKKFNSKTLLAWVSAFAFALCTATSAMAYTATPVHCGSCGVGGDTDDHKHDKKDEKKKDEKKDEKKKDDKPK